MAMSVLYMPLGCCGGHIVPWCVQSNKSAKATTKSPKSFNDINWFTARKTQNSPTGFWGQNSPFFRALIKKMVEVLRWHKPICYKPSAKVLILSSIKRFFLCLGDIARFCKKLIGFWNKLVEYSLTSIRIRTFRDRMEPKSVPWDPRLCQVTGAPPAIDTEVPPGCQTTKNSEG